MMILNLSDAVLFPCPQVFLLGALAKLGATLCTYPLLVVKVLTIFPINLVFNCEIRWILMDTS